MQRLIDAALSVLLAPECAACSVPLDAPTAGAVCGKCWNAVVPIAAAGCQRCSEPLVQAQTLPDVFECERCRSHGWPIDGARAVGSYEGSLKAIVHAFKYDGRRSLATRLGLLMRQQHADFLATAQVAVPVPLHAARQRERGFNQALDLARHIGLPVVPALARIRRTLIQAELSAGARLENVRDAFAPTRKARQLAGRAVMLVDDVSTTGATLAACAFALRTVGICRVYAITVARAVRSRP